MPEPLKCVQLMSEPEAPESVPQEKVPPAHSSLSAEVLQVERLAPKKLPDAVSAVVDAYTK